ncbi:MAG: 37S ribosomal protein S23 mitochondrial [Candelina submexicana]|nr:MAG: 37S ribosomal protein S23 mitochondrial [Candelina submexicana]
MAASTCYRCLLRASSVSHKPPLASTPSYLIPSTTSSFSTSASLLLPAPPPKKSSGTAAIPKRGEKQLVLIKTKTRVSKGKPPNPGERKAMRKRIVLSNTNALEVTGMQDLNEDTMVDMRLRGQVIGLPGSLGASTDSVVDQLRAVEAFKTTQGWGLFRRPGMLIRRESVELGKLLAGIVGEGEKKTIRRVYTGEKGNGKSMMLLQAMAMAYLKGWIVISIPEGSYPSSHCHTSIPSNQLPKAHELTIGTTSYSPLPNTSPTKYIQPNYLASLLARTVRANRRLLSTLSLTRTHNLSFPLQSNISLDRLANLGANDPDIAWPIFQTLWSELTTPASETEKRPPILLAMDGLGHFMRGTSYRDADFNLIHAHDLALVDHLMTYLSGTKTLPNGGAIFAATSGSNTPSTPTLSLALKQAEARAAGTDIPQFSPFETYDQRVLDAVKGVEVVKLGGLTREEARGLIEYYAASGAIRQVVDERLVSEKWTLAGGGIVGELEKGTVRMRI